MSSRWWGLIRPRQLLPLCAVLALTALSLVDGRAQNPVSLPPDSTAARAQFRPELTHQMADVMRLSITDCNDNLISDSLEIARHFVSDTNNNGIPDPCD